MFLKIHHSDKGDVVAVCDRELLNTTQSHGKISVTITPAFYGESLATEEEVRAALKNACNVNLMGERAVTVAINMGLITRDSCIVIGKIPHAQIYQV